MFLKENLEYHMVQYHFRKFEKIEIMALISMEKKVIEKNEFEKLSITYSQALMLFSVKIQYNLKYYQFNRKSPTCFLRIQLTIVK